MDMYSFIESEKIAEHCRSTNHQFTSLEMATIISHNVSKTFKEKHFAFKKIIAEYPDMPIRDKGYYIKDRESLHEYLQDLIDWEENWLEEFYKPEVGAVYVPLISWRDGNNEFGGCYSTVDKAWTVTFDRCKDNDSGDWDWENDNVSYVCISKVFIDVDDASKIWVNSKGEATNSYGTIDGCPGYIDEVYANLPLWSETVVTYF